MFNFHVRIDGVPLCRSRIEPEVRISLENKGFHVTCGHLSWAGAAQLAYALNDRGYKAVAHNDPCPMAQGEQTQDCVTT